MSKGQDTLIITILSVSADLFELFLLHVVVLAVDDHLSVDEDDVEFEGVHHLDLTTLRSGH